MSASSAQESTKTQQRIKSVASTQVAAVGGQDKVAWTGEIPEHEINFIFDQNDLNKMVMQNQESTQKEMSSKTTTSTSSIEKQIGSSDKKASTKSSINLVFDGNDLSKETIKSQESSNISMSNSKIEQQDASSAAKSSASHLTTSSCEKRSASALSTASTTASQAQFLNPPSFPSRAESAMSDTGSSREYYVTTPSEQERQMKEKKQSMMQSSFAKSHQSSLMSHMDMIRESFDEEMNQMAREFDQRCSRSLLDHDSFFSRNRNDDFFSRGHSLLGARGHPQMIGHPQMTGEVITKGKSKEECFVETSSSVTENGVTRSSKDTKYYKSDNDFPSLKHSIFDVGRDNFLDPPTWSALEWNRPSSVFRRSGVRDSSRLHDERRMIESSAAQAEAKSKLAEKERMDSIANTTDRGFVSTTNPDQFEVEVDVQGFSPDELFVRTEGKKLIITAQAKEESGNSDNAFKREIKKEFDLPDDVNPYDVSSRLLPDGFLRVEAPIKK